MDEKKIAQYEKLDKFIAERLANDIYPEIPGEPHLSITRDMIGKLQNHAKLENARILDCGCGQGLALEIFTKKGAKPTGLTFGEDWSICKKRGFDAIEMDFSFLDFPDESFDVIWCRHAIEHSLFPLFTLKGFHEVLKPGGLLYIEVPAPTTSALHETNPNHYSCFTAPVWLSIFAKSNFEVVEALDLTFQVQCGPDLYHAFFLRKLNQ